MKKIAKYIIRTVEYKTLHPLLSKYFQDQFNSSLLPKLWSKYTVIFHTGRSGSTVLSNLLGQTKEIFCDNEIYHPFLEYISYQSNQSPADSIKVLQNRMILQKLFHIQKTIYNCEIKPFHLRIIKISLQAYLNYLKTLGFKHFIILKRENYLRMIVSSLISQQKLNKYHISSRKKSHLQKLRLEVDKKNFGNNKALIPLLQQYQNDFKNLESVLHDELVLKLTYENDISNNPHIGAKKVCEFLGIQYQEGKIKYGKTNPFPLNEIIENYDEVKQTLQKTPFEWMIYS